MERALDMVGQHDEKGARCCRLPAGAAILTPDDKLNAAVEALGHARRNVYQLQMGGDRLCEALRKIVLSDDIDTAKSIAAKALKHKEPEPKWATLAKIKETP
jgi:hypothetical protein